MSYSTQGGGEEEGDAGTLEGEGHKCGGGVLYYD